MTYLKTLLVVQILYLSQSTSGTEKNHERTSFRIVGVKTKIQVSAEHESEVPQFEIWVKSTLHRIRERICCWLFN